MQLSRNYRRGKFNDLTRIYMGYGFVLIDGNPDAEYFIHFTSIDMDGYKTLKAGQPVSFILKNTEKGIQATEVKLL